MVAFFKLFFGVDVLFCELNAKAKKKKNQSMESIGRVFKLHRWFRKKLMLARRVGRGDDVGPAAERTEVFKMSCGAKMGGVRYRAAAVTASLFLFLENKMKYTHTNIGKDAVWEVRVYCTSLYLNSFIYRILISSPGLLYCGAREGGGIRARESCSCLLIPIIMAA